MVEDDGFHYGIDEVPIKKGYVPAESRFPTADEAHPPSGGSDVTPPASNEGNDDNG